MRWKKGDIEVMNKNYFNYLVTQNKKQLLVLFLLGFAFVPVITMINVDPYNMDNPYSYGSSLSGFILYSVLLIGLTYIVPLFNYRFIQYKRSCDTFLSLPIKRETLCNTVTVFSLALMYVPYIINVIFGAIVLIVKGYPFVIGSFIAYLVISLLLVSVLYFMNTLIVLKCNNSIDSVICMIGYSLLPVVIYLAFAEFMDMYTFGVNGFYNFDWPQSIHTMIASTGFFLYHAFSIATNQAFNYCWCVFYLALGLVFGAWSAITFVKRNAESSEQISDSQWMYRLLIPLYAFFTLTFFTVSAGMSDTIITVIVVFIIYSVATFIANRKVALSKWSIVAFIGVVIITKLAGSVFKHTLAPSISLNFPTSFDHMEVNIYSHSDDFSMNSEYLEITDSSDIALIQGLQKELVEDYYNDVVYDNTNSHLHIYYYDSHNNERKSYYYPLSNEKSKVIYELALANNTTVYGVDYSKPNAGEFTVSKDQLDQLLAIH